MNKPSVDSWYPGKSKPLSETHQTLFAQFHDKHGLGRVITPELVQSCTVDVAEHEQLKKELFTAVDNYGKLEAEVGRLKKELEKYRLEFGKYFDEGVAEGERRATEKVNLALHDDALFILCPALEEKALRQVRRYMQNVLGLGEAGGVAECGTVRSYPLPKGVEGSTPSPTVEVKSFGEESTGNDNYTNKGAE